MKEVWPEVEPNFRAAGGLSNSEALLQIIADVLAVPVISPAERRASAIGSAIAGFSFVESENPSKIVRDTIELNKMMPSKDSEMYESIYRRWRLIYDRIGDLV